MADIPLTNLERMRIQMEYAVPLIRDLQRQLGADVVNEALARRTERETRETAAPGSKADFGRMEAGTAHFAAGGALEYDIVDAGDDHFDLNVTSCGYARMMDDLDARDIGHLLICNLDFPAAARLGMDLERTQTQMEGGTQCDFRYRRRPDH
jgi:hypothetical protein